MIDPLVPLAPRHVNLMLLHGALREVAGAAPPRRDGTVYEVLRVHAGRPIFFKEHIARMQNSASLAGLTFPPAAQWYAPLLQLCQQQQGTQNLQLMLLEDGALEAHFIESHYPTPLQVKTGVAVGVIDGERPCPHAKRAGHAVRAAADRVLKETTLFEVLLRNRAGEITEGSRSNVLFVTQGRFVTPPLAAVLPGITLAKVKQSATHLSFTWEERPVRSDELSTFAAAAVLGTSPGVLPIRSIAMDGEAIQLDAGHSALQKLRVAYGELMRQTE